MSTDALWRIALRLLRASSHSGGAGLELLSNDELDHWLEDHRD